MEGGTRGKQIMKEYKVYISGKIGKLPPEEVEKNFRDAWNEFVNWPRWNFDSLWACLRSVSPLDLPHQHDKSWTSYMLEDLAALAGCDAILMCKNWRDSPGARIEHDFAHRAGLDVYYQ